MAGFYVQDPDEIVYVAKGAGPDAGRSLTEDQAHAVLFDTEAEAEAWCARLDPHLGPLTVVAQHEARPVRQHRLGAAWRHASSEEE